MVTEEGSIEVKKAEYRSRLVTETLERLYAVSAFLDENPTPNDFTEEERQRLCDTEYETRFRPSVDVSAYRLRQSVSHLLSAAGPYLDEEVVESMNRYLRDLQRQTKLGWASAYGGIKDGTLRQTIYGLLEIVQGVYKTLVSEHLDLERGSPRGRKHLASSLVIIMISVLSLGWLLSFSNTTITSRVVGIPPMNIPVIIGLLAIVGISLAVLFKR